MTRPAQNLLLVLLGAAMLWITLVTAEYLNYVKPWFRFLLAGGGALLIALGATGLYKGRHRADLGDQQDHGHGPGVAWLLLLPVLAIFLIAPPPLGSFTAARSDSRPAAQPQAQAAGESGFSALTGTGPAEMTIGEFVGRAWQEHYGGSPTGLRGRTVKLTGFVTPAGKTGGGWLLTRMRITCCAADGIPMQVIVGGQAAPPADTWVQVSGIWVPDRPTQTVPFQKLTATSVQRIAKPREPYE